MTTSDTSTVPVRLDAIDPIDAGERGQSEQPGHDGGRWHVVHGVLSLELGGLERLVIDLVRIGRQRGQRQSVVCIEQAGQLAAAAKEAGADVFSLDKPPRRSAAVIGQSADLLRWLRPDVVHAHQTGALWYLGQGARQVGGIGVLHTEHSDHVAHARTWRGKLRTRWLWHQTARWTDRFCCVSADIATSARRWGTVPARKVDVVLNGIDTQLYEDRSNRETVRAELGIADSAVVIGTVGRLVEVKRQDLLIRAFAEIARNNPDVQLLVVGDGPERSRLESLTARLGLTSRVVFAGYQPRPEQSYQAMDVFALSSRHEGLPLALLEAWAAGLPVVVPAVGGIAKVVQHDRTGLLFPKENAVALAAALLQLLHDASLSKRLAAAGRDTVRESYSLERMADEYERHYAAIMGADKRCGS